MNKFLFGAAAAVALFAVGCATPEAICKSGVDQVCERQFECRGDTIKANDQLKAAYGASVEECKTKLYAAQSCESKKEENELCTDGKTFHLDKASECSDARAAQSCADYLDATKIPAVCAEKCQ